MVGRRGVIAVDEVEGGMVGFGFILFGHYELWHVFSAKSFNIYLNSLGS